MSSKVLLPSFNAHIQPQLNEIIADLLSEANPRECLLAPLNKVNWYKASDYNDITLHHNKAELSIHGWLDAVEAITGDNTAFEAVLVQQIQDTVEQQWQIRMQESDEDMRFEEEFEIERAAVA